jgi:hypothetical protein
MTPKPPKPKPDPFAIWHRPGNVPTVRQLYAAHAIGALISPDMKPGELKAMIKLAFWIADHMARFETDEIVNEEMPSRGH